MRVEGASLIYLDDHEGNDWQSNMRMIVRPRTTAKMIGVELSNNSDAQDCIEGSDQYYIDLKPAEAREIAAALILAADTAAAITQQGEKT